VPATSAARNRLLFFFFAAFIYSTNEANKAGGMRHLAVYNFLDVYDYDTVLVAEMFTDHHEHLFKLDFYVRHLSV
jgi:hypothetical protein